MDIFQTNTGQSAMGIGAPVICGQNTGQHSKLEKTKVKLCFLSLQFKLSCCAVRKSKQHDKY